MAITLGTMTNEVGVFNDTPNYTMSHNHNGDFLIVAVANHYSDPLAVPNAVTYAGVSMTKVDSHGTSYAHAFSVWVLVTGASYQGANNVISTFASDPVAWYGVVMAQSVSGVDQTTPYGTVGQANADGSASGCTVDVSSESGGLVVDCVSFKNLNGDTDIGSPGGGQTTILDTESGTGSAGYGDFASSYESGASTVTMSWTLTGDTTLASWKLTAIPLKASGGATTYPMYAYAQQ